MTTTTNRRTRQRPRQPHNGGSAMSAPSIEEWGPTSIVHFWLSAIDWPDQAITRRFLYTLTSAAMTGYLDRRNLKKCLRRCEGRGWIQRGAYVLKITDREALARHACPPLNLDTAKFRLVLDGVRAYIADGDNTMLRARMATELETLNEQLALQF